MDAKNTVVENHHRSRASLASRARHRANTARTRTEKTEVITPGEDEIQIDLDGPRAVREFNRRVRQFRHWLQELDECRMMVLPSRSGKRGHYHVTVRTGRPIHTDLHRVCLASLFGSDPIREIINYVRVTQNRPYPICFFRATNVSPQREKWTRLREILR